MRRTLLVLVAFACVGLGAGIARSANGGTMAQARNAGWNCDPVVLIGGYYHCAPPGKASVLAIVTGAASPSSVEVRVFRPDGSFAGTESLLRADLYAGQPCVQDGKSTWDLLDLPVDYRACHHFDT